jgi:Ca-activated chloride channel homolog
MWRFEHPEFFLLFGGLFLLAGFYIFINIHRQRVLHRLGDAHLVHLLVPNVSLTKRIVKFVLWFFAMSSFILGLCNLQTGSKVQEVKREGADIMVCLDVSKSMLAEDIKPNRLTRAVQAMEKFIDRLKGDRLGIVVFAGNAYVQLPITTDYSAAKLFLNSISPDMIPVQGTNITDAITKAEESFPEDEGKNRAIIIITDGEDHEEDAIKKAEAAGEKQIMINTIGVGSESGVPIPEYRNGYPVGYKKDRDGNTVVTKLNSSLLKEIAGKANGVYVQASNADIGLNAVLDKIDELDKKQRESKMYTDYEDQFRIFFLVSFVLLLVEFAMNERISQFWKRLNIFKEFEN